MPKIPLLTAKRIEIEESIQQDTPDCAEPITPGPVRLVTATGNIVRAKADAAPNARVYGIASRTAPQNTACTVIRRGVMYGYDFTGVAFDADIFLDNDGDLNTAPGTVATRIGRVIAVKANLLGKPHHKALSVEL